MKERTIAVIPARYGSSRFPGKPLALIAGKPMIQRTVESTMSCPAIDEVLVATDDPRIMDAVQKFGGNVVMTSANHKTGTDRIAEAIQDVEADLILNVQGDEPMMDPNVLQQLVVKMRETKADMGTVAVPFDIVNHDPADPNCVKVVLDKKGFALYFSRACIPYLRSGCTPVTPLLHWGLYAYTRNFLTQFVQWDRGDLEACESLEQLRALENGARIWVLQAKECSMGVDVPEDIAIVEEMLKNKECSY
ncbi:MAG: 3-deoxy-manno-octulosonate cytidylyltransferase [Lentisphaeria bacterium]